MPENGPYYGRYNLSSYFLLLNKIGFATPTSSISKEIVNPGRYFTLFGALFLDFGFLGMFISTFFIYFFAGHTFKKYDQKQKFISLIWFLYFYTIIILSPVYSLIGNSIYPGFLSALIIISVFYKFLNYRKKNIIKQ